MTRDATADAVRQLHHPIPHMINHACGLFPDLSTGDKCPLPGQTGRDETVWMRRPIKDKSFTADRQDVGRCPSKLPEDWAAQAPRPAWLHEDLEVAKVCGVAPPLTTADGRVCNDRSLAPLVGTGD